MRYIETLNMIAIVKKHSTTNVSEHLSLKEFDCHCNNPFCRHTLVNYRVGVIFESLRELCGNKPIRVNSAFRCSEHNFSVGGVHLSKHLLGEALDLAPPADVSLDDFKLLAKQAGFTFVYINKDKNFMHVDIRR